MKELFLVYVTLKNISYILNLLTEIKKITQSY